MMDGSFNDESAQAGGKPLPHEKRALPHEKRALPHEKRALPHEERGQAGGKPLPHQKRALPHEERALPHEERGQAGGKPLPHQKRALPHEERALPHAERALPHEERALPRKIALAHRWHTSLPAALAEARATGKPVLNLWLLGRLDEELSCANSRFFRKTLYPDPRVHRVLAEHFVLCWTSFRAVPVVTIDFGDGRRLVRTLTGNSAHVILDARGRPADALPGVYRPRAFVSALAWSARLARAVSPLGDAERARVLAKAHLAPPALPLEIDRAPRPTRPTAREAGQIAMTKLRVEAPLLDGTRDLFESLALDEERNERELRPQIHAMFARGGVGTDASVFAHDVYRDVFLMPHDDPWLGLRAFDSALPNDGVW
jgi:hypothetical protein